MLESVLIRRIDAYCAQGALQGPIWRRFHARMPIEVGLREDRVALVALFVLLAILTLVDEMLIQRLDLYHLLTLPACR